jgi:membrane protease YdiL (CAAX protease family)
MEANHVKTKIGYLLNTNKTAKISEILFLFILAFALYKILKPYAGDNLVLKMGMIWCINILMLLLVWSGIKLRGQNYSDFGLRFRRINLKDGLKVFLRSLLVCVLATLGYVLGTIIMANISGMPESADMSNYEYLHNNVFMLILTLLGVYMVSSFGEEVVYRAFLINRLTELGLDSKYGKWAAVIISAVIFGLVHLEWGLTGTVSTAFMGLVLGIFYLKFNRNLWILVLAHAYMDTLLLVPLYLAST